MMTERLFSDGRFHAKALWQDVATDHQTIKGLTSVKMDHSTYPYGKSLYKPYIMRVFLGYNTQEHQGWTQ